MLPNNTQGYVLIQPGRQQGEKKTLSEKVGCSFHGRILADSPSQGLKGKGGVEVPCGHKIFAVEPAA